MNWFTVGGGSPREAIVFPYDFAPTGLSSFPAGWTGSDTFVISSDVVTNTPETGDEMLADPGLEGTYTGGANGSVIFTGGVTNEITSGVHGGSKAQEWTPDANYQSALDIKTPEAKEWYKFTEWVKRMAGTGGTLYAGLEQTMVSHSRRQTSATYAQYGGVCYSDAVANLFAYFSLHYGGAFDTVVFDDASLKKLVKTSLPKLVNGAAGYTAKIKATWDSNNLIGVISHSDGTLDNCLLALYITLGYGVYSGCVLFQFVDGVRTQLVSDYTNTPSAGGGGVPTSDHWLEIRYTNTNKVTLFHNDIAVGAEQNIPAGLQANTYYGFFDTGGGNSLNRFFAGDLTAVNIGAAGSSNTYSATGYWYDLYNHEKPQYLVTRLNAAANGEGITSYTLPNYASLAGSVQVIGDTTGDTTNPDSLWSIEAFIRKCHADGYRLLLAVMPVWSNGDLNNGQVNAPANLTVLEAIISLCDHYGVTYVNMLAQTQAHVTGGGDLADLWADVYHLTDAGQLVAAAGLAPYYVTGGAIPSPLAARVYEESEALE